MAVSKGNCSPDAHQLSVPPLQALQERYDILTRQHSSRYTTGMLKTLLQCMGCKPRTAHKVGRAGWQCLLAVAEVSAITQCWPAPCKCCAAKHDLKA